MYAQPLFYMKYTDAIEYINEISMNKGSVYGLDSIRELCRRMGNPQDDLKYVHIAGTNGKGSTLAFISHTLMLAGLKVGRYISPTIRDYRERFQVNEHMMSIKALGEYMESVKAVCDDMVEDGYPQPTAFEIETAIAFLFFKDKGTDIVVLETGMGGKEDATNIVKTTIMCVFASISMDHMQFLGDTLGKIAENKCGIIKPGVPVVTGFQKEEVMAVIEDRCHFNKSSLRCIFKRDISKESYKGGKQSFVFENVRYETGLKGSWQNENAALAILALKTLRETYGYTKLSDATILKGIETTAWPARFETISRKPLFIIDGAHNADAALRLRETIDLYYSDKRKIFIVGMFRDKEVDKVIETVAYDGSMIFTTATPGSSRAMSPVELAEVVKPVNPNVTSCDSVEEAVEFATSFADKDSVIIAFGSLAYLGKIIDIFAVK